MNDFNKWFDKEEHDLYNFPIDAMKEAWDESERRKNNEIEEMLKNTASLDKKVDVAGKKLNAAHALGRLREAESQWECHLNTSAGFVGGALLGILGSWIWGMCL